VAIKLGDMLIKGGMITDVQLQAALKEQSKSGGRVGSNLIKLGHITEEDLTKFLGRQYGVPSVNLNDVEIGKNVLDIIPADVAMKHEVLPINKAGKTITVAMANPADVLAVEDLKFSTGYEIRVVVASESAIQKTIEKYYEATGMLKKVMKEVQEGEEDVEVMSTEDEKEEGMDIAAADSAPVVKLVNAILLESVSKMASDIHVEPYEKELRVRYRIDGVLHDMMTPPWKMRKAIVSRLKIMAKMKIAEKRLPQDGRVKVVIKGRPIDLRVSTIPTLYGEKMALRVLDRSTVNFDLETLGFEKSSLLDVNVAITKPYGIVLVTGPTGSGKTTTLYAALIKLNSADVNITTAEDPVEYSLLGVNQVQMKEDVGLTFASSLRSYLRQDPDIIMVGEIRDQETAEISIRASLTGHLVLSTVHTNSAAATITRLINMGIEPFLIASTLNLVESQRLVRNICTACKEPYTLAGGLLSDDEQAIVGDAQLFKGKGCKDCSNTGYRGRSGVYEVMTISPPIRDLILDDAPTEEIAAQAKKDGMIDLRHSALLKMKSGITDIDEVIRSIGSD
jgi:type IV pilus assembly protein PilB